MSGSISSITIPESQPFPLPESDVVGGVLGEIQPYAPGMILVGIGHQLVILPGEIEKKLARYAGARIEILRQDNKYSVAML